jgi:hypothetical protein
MNQEPNAWIDAAYLVSSEEEAFALDHGQWVTRYLGLEVEGVVNLAPFEHKLRLHLNLEAELMGRV